MTHFHIENKTKEVSPYRKQNLILHYLYNPIPKKDTRKRGKNYLKIKFQEIRKYYPEWEYLEIGIDLDHIRLYMVITPKYAVSKVVETIK